MSDIETIQSIIRKKNNDLFNLQIKKLSKTMTLPVGKMLCIRWARCVTTKHDSR